MERAFIVGVNLDGDSNFELSMDELASLAQACEMEVVGRAEQNMEYANTATYIGAGKVEEVRQAAEYLEADIVIFDNALSPVQLRNLQRELDKPVMDRTTLILEIFSTRAKTREAKLQVEVARLQYMLPRLVGLHDALSRQGGASGAMSNKGAGEKKLELDRRRLEQRLTNMKRELDLIAGERRTQRQKRARSGIPRVALVGYTNAGKSTLFNFITQANVYAADHLFATLDPTLRRLQIQDVGTAILADTVGFVRQLPHDLVSAFKSTLQETVEASLLLHVIDAADARKIENIEAVNLVLEEIKADKVPALLVYNKIDLLENVAPHIEYDDENKPVAVYLSAHSGEGLDLLLEAIKVRLKNEILSFTLTLLPQEGKIRHALYQLDSIRHEQISDEGEFILNVQIDKVEWLKLCKQFPKLSEIIY